MQETKKKILKWIGSWAATIEILCDRELMKDLKEAKAEFERGESIPWNYPPLRRINTIKAKLIHRKATINKIGE